MSSFFDRINAIFQSEPEEPVVRLGRYSDAYKTQEQHNFVDMASQYFEQRKYNDAYGAFFKYLYDKKEDNLKWEETADGWQFQILQGSKRIIGFTNQEEVTATIKVVKAQKFSVAFLRKLLEVNYQLQFSSYAIDNDTVCIKFSTSVIDGSPQKLYYALREMATRADRQDDVFLGTYSGLQAIDSGHITPLSLKEKEIKFNYFKHWINTAITEIEALDTNIYSLVISYRLLNLAYKIDYLVTPHGSLMDHIEKVHLHYFGPEDLTEVERNAKMLKEFKNMLAISQNDFNKQVYGVKSTFGIANYTTPANVVAFILESLKNIQENKKDKQANIQKAILEYVSSYCLFHFGLPDTLHQLFHLQMRLFNNDIFVDLGFTSYLNEDGSIIHKFVKKKLQSIEKHAQQKYPNFKLNTRGLDYQDVLSFSQGLMVQIAQNNFSEKK